ncbi:hypothetical protein ACFQ14_08620 [Pseudahrensia aquimaris]|uniref:Uncharacterized protein n=1 Tax=Pseudahrensia aquimaris TaxID=744461 RepID=A0ABW3FFG6_9HYPH
MAAPSSLFSHDGDDHRLKINRNTDTDTASLIFQSNFSGRAEFGLAGEDAWSVKVSPNGSNWQTALRAQSATGEVDFPNGLSVSGGDRFDHFESGTWVPTLSGSNGGAQPSYAAQDGNFIRIGNFVFVSGRLGWSAPGNLDGQLRISDLPFPCEAGLQNRTALNMAWYDGLSLPTNATQLGGFIEPGTDTVRLWGAVNAYEGINLIMQTSHLGQSGIMYFSCIYRA